MRNDEEFFRQVAMQEIVCPCGENCLDQKGRWKRVPKETSKKKTGNKMVSKHLTLDGLLDCIGSYVFQLHEKWIRHDSARIKLEQTCRVVRRKSGLIGKDIHWIMNQIRMGFKDREEEMFKKVIEKLKFHQYSQPSEVDDAASREFGQIWAEMAVLLNT